jgi:hypothetical protein
VFVELNRLKRDIEEYISLIETFERKIKERYSISKIEKTLDYLEKLKKYSWI